MKSVHPKPSPKYALWITCPPDKHANASLSGSQFETISYHDLVCGIELCMDKLCEKEKEMVDRINSYYQAPHGESSWILDGDGDPYLFVDCVGFRSLLRIVLNGTEETQWDLSVTLRRVVEFLDSLVPSPDQLKLELVWGW
ncbi:hypothetical protein [Streptomyces sp. NPDC001966]